MKNLEDSQFLLRALPCVLLLHFFCLFCACGGGLSYIVAGEPCMPEHAPYCDDTEISCLCDGSGRLSAEQSGRGILVYSYSEQQSALTIGEDLDSDGTLEAQRTRYFDVDGHPTRLELDEDGNGVVDTIHSFEMDDNGDVRLTDIDLGADGTVELRTHFDLDIEGNIVLEERDLDADGTIEWRGFFEYDETGNRIREEGDTNADGTIDIVFNHFYNSEGLRTGTVVDEDADNSDDEVLWFEYDEWGFRVRVEGTEDPTRNTQPTWQCVYYPSCPPPYSDCDRLRSCFDASGNDY